MITANIAYIEPQPCKRLAIIPVQVLETWDNDGRTWAKVRALEGNIFPRLPVDGPAYFENWTVVDRERLHDVRMAFPGQQGRPSWKKKTQKYDEIVLREQLLGGKHGHKQST
jgi:hypothetical protein